MTELVDPDHCPLCGDENHCGMRAGSKTCWCFSANLVPGVLDRVPPEAQRVACCCEVADDLTGSRTTFTRFSFPR